MADSVLADDAAYLKALAAVAARSKLPRPRQGLLLDTVTRVVAQQPGLSSKEVAAAVLRAEPCLFHASVPQQLRRGALAGLYRREDGRWFSTVQPRRTHGR